MPAVRPRVSVVLDENVADTLRRVAAVQGRSVSSVVGDLVTEFEPGLRQVAELGEALDRLNGEQRDAVRRSVAAADQDIAGPLGHAIEQLQAVMGRVHEFAQDAAAGGDRPPLGNTGVRSDGFERGD